MRQQKPRRKEGLRKLGDIIALHKRARELQTVADYTPEIVTRFDRELRHVFVSAAIERATGIPPAEFLGKTHREMGIPAKHCDQWSKALRSVFKRGVPETVSFRFDTREGPRDFAALLVPEPGPTGEVHHVLSFARDCTDERAAEQVLRDANQRKDIFLATLAHELRNPLAPIRLAARIIQLQHTPHEEVLRCGAMIERQAAHMASLLEELLDIARISRGTLELRERATDLADILAGGVETASAMMKAKAQTLNVELPPKPVLLNVDPVRFSQVLSNLLTNASKYSDQGSVISLRAAISGHELTISVRDSGIGLTAEALPHVFEMFTQEKASIERSQGGLGIGLALVKGLVELHGGHVEARSDGLNQGSEFIVHLPLEVVASRGQAKPTKPPDAAHARPRRVLIADDNADAAASLSVLLQLGGHEVFVAHSGIEALEAAKNERPEVLILDIGMPGLNGYQVARGIREQPWGREVMLIAATGYGQAGDVQEAIAAGFDHHLTKPIDPGVLDRLIGG